MTPRLFVRSQARADIRKSRRWYRVREREQERGLAAEFMRAIRTTLASIEQNPLLYATARGEIRRALVRRFPYAIYYVPERDGTTVIAVLHVRRDPQVWQTRVHERPEIP